MSAEPRIALAVEGLAKRFGAFAALKHVSFAVRKHSIHSLIGPNGAGKTTLFNCLTGALKPSAGRVVFDGRDITHLPPHRRARIGMGRSFQVTNLFQSLTVFESLRLAAQAQTGLAALDFVRPKERLGRAVADAELVLERLGLGPYRDAKAGELSHGRQRLLEVGLALAVRPSLVLLDEPTAGMGVEDIGAMKELIATLARDYTIVLIEHNMRVVLDISDMITVMHLGEVLVEGRPDAVRRDHRVKAAYLGSEG